MGMIALRTSQTARPPRAPLPLSQGELSWKRAKLGPLELAAAVDSSASVGDILEAGELTQQLMSKISVERYAYPNQPIEIEVVTKYFSGNGTNVLVSAGNNYPNVGTVQAGLNVYAALAGNNSLIFSGGTFSAAPFTGGALTTNALAGGAMETFSNLKPKMFFGGGEAVLSGSVGAWQYTSGNANDFRPVSFFGGGPAIEVVGGTGTSFSDIAVANEYGQVAEIIDLNEIAPDPFESFGKYTSPNWDGYGAEPIAPETLDAARSLYAMLPNELAYPDIAPSADSTIGFEWVRTTGPMKKLFIDIGPNETWRAYWRKTSGLKKVYPPQKLRDSTKTKLVELVREATA
jgi:hypothetical protein